MRVTPPTKPSEVLEAAKKYLAPKPSKGRRKRSYICFALDEVSQQYHESSRAVEEVKRRIMLCLYPSTSLSGWLRWTGKVDFICLEDGKDLEKLYITRLAWIDHMIVLYKEQGR